MSNRLHEIRQSTVVNAEEVHMPSRSTKPAVIAAFVFIAVASMRYGSLPVVDAEEVYKPSGGTEATPGVGTEQSSREIHKPNESTEVHKPSESTKPAVIAAFASFAVAIMSAIVSLRVTRQQLRVPPNVRIDVAWSKSGKVGRERRRSK